MRVLIVGVVPTHLMSMVPLTWALRAAGHPVLVSGNAGFVRRAAMAGLSGAVVPDPPPAPASAPPPAPGPLDFATMAERWRHRVGAVVGAHLEIARSWRPDVVLCDPIEFSGLIVAGVLGVPAVVHRWGADPVSTETLPRAARALHDIAVRHGADGVSEPALVLDPCPPSLQCPGAAPAQPIRFLPFNGVGDRPAWAAERTSRRRIAVSFGSESAMLSDPRLWNVLMTALAGIDGLDTVVTGRPPEGGHRPATVRADGALPLDLFLAGQDALLHHGGSGTCLTAIHYGVPQLAFAHPSPSYAAHAERVEACGAGRALDLNGEHGSPAALRRAVEDVLTDPRYRTATGRLREEMHRQPSPTAIVSLLGDLAAVHLGR